MYIYIGYEEEMNDAFPSNQSSPFKGVRRGSSEKILMRSISGRMLSRQPSLIDMLPEMDPKLLKMSKDLSGFKFEKSLTLKEESVYVNHLDIISNCCKTNPVPFLELTQWLLEVGLGVEAIAVLNIGIHIYKHTYLNIHIYIHIYSYVYILCFYVYISICIYIYISRVGYIQFG
jgi:hypothetical protein